MTISVIVPIYNEKGNLDKLFNQLFVVLDGINCDYEIIGVDDGSIDGSFEMLGDIARKNNKVKVISFARNRGQTAALTAGIDNANGDVIILIDSDLENDPKDIVKLIDRLNDGYDVVSGWRRDRWKGSWLTRKLPSLVANWLISKISGVKLHDYGCTLKVYRRKVIKDILLYGEMHRFIPVYAHWQGGKVVEVEVSYRQREYGKSKYGLFRTYRVLLDLIIIKFLDKYMNKPIHFFGGLGFLSFFIGVMAGVVAVALKFTGTRAFVATPLPIFSALFIIVGVQLVAIGVVAEMVMRTYYESQNKKTYTIKEKINFDQ